LYGLPYQTLSHTEVLVTGITKMQISYDVTNSSHTLSSRGASFFYSHFVRTDQVHLIPHEY
jgi:hypothetical protein